MAKHSGSSASLVVFVVFWGWVAVGTIILLFWILKWLVLPLLILRLVIGR